jgi:hypothetical protein
MIVFTLTWVGPDLPARLLLVDASHFVSAGHRFARLRQEMTARIEHWSKAEHDLIQEVHPQVNEIKDQMDSVAEAVSHDSSSAQR